MFLEMYINGLLIERVLINFEHYPTVSDREAFLYRSVILLRKQHYDKLKHSRIEPVFYIDHVPSKMNYSTYNAR